MRQTLYTIIFISLIFLTPFVSYSQNSTELPRIVPPPADAASLGKYGDVPVNLSVGLPNITVPIYEIKTPRLSVPISLSYFASGVKVDDIASWVGLEWSLNAGGIITRTVKAKDDFSSGGYYANNNLPLADTLSPASWAFMNNVIAGSIDLEPDYFFYNFLNYSGKYVFGEDKKPKIINYKDPLKIQYNSSSSSFTIVDGQGNQYLFIDKDTTQSYSTSLANFPSNNMTYTSSWYLSSIISFDKSDTINFKYFKGNQLFQNFKNYSEGLGASWTCSVGGGTSDQGITHDGVEVVTSQSFINSTPLHLQEINFKNGKITFFSSGPRTDNNGFKLDSLTIYGFDYASQSYKSLKTVKFSYDYFTSTFSGTTGYKLRLNSMNTVGNKSEDGGKYRFLYDSTTIPLLGSLAKDMFNYYNGANTNRTLVPAQSVNYNGIFYNVGSADRSTNPTYLQAGILKHIYYPTGGRTDFSYEPNSFSEQRTTTTNVSKSALARGNQPMGSIPEIDTTVFVASSTIQASYSASITRYNYPGVQTRPYVSFIDLTSSQTIYSNYLPDPNNGLTLTATAITLQQGHTYQLIAGAFQDNRISSSITVNWTENTTTLATVNGGGLRIKQITDYDYTGRFAKSILYKYGTNESGYGYLPSQFYLFNNTVKNLSTYLGCDGGISGCISVTYGRKIFNTSSIYDVFNLSGASLSYPEVAKYLIDSTGNISGKTIYDYSVYTNNILPVSAAYNDGIYITNSGWEGGLLLSQADYAYKNSQYFPVRKAFNTYKKIALTNGRGSIVDHTVQVNGCHTADPNPAIPYYSFDYPIFTGTVVPDGQTVYDYDISDTTKYVATTKQFTFDNLDHLQPTRIVTTESKGTTLLSVNRYPVEVDSIGGLSSGEIAAIDTLQSRHNITPLIQAQTFRNGSPVNLTRTNYKIWSANLILPDSIETQEGTFPIEKRVQFDKYDVSGNLVQDAKASDVTQVYLWDYNRSLPIAACTAADSGSIAYTSFEANGSGNWTIGSASRDTGSVTGKRSYILSSGAISKTGLMAAQYYTVSYWTKNSSAYTINGTISGYPIRGKTIGLWTYYEHVITGQTSVSLSGTGNVDELRLYPSNAEMTTYTYDPLVGMTSQCDLNNRVTYYEYDGVQRLKLIRDQDQNIIKTFQYHFINQP